MLIKQVKMGDRVHVGDRYFDVLRMESSATVVLGLDDGEEVRLNWRHPLDVFPDVNVQVSRHSLNTPAVLFTLRAPRSMEITAGPPEGAT